MESGFKMTQPVSIWNQELGVDFRSMFRDLADTATGAALAGVTGSPTAWGRAASSALKSLSNLEIKDNPGQLAWLLIRRALVRAIFELVSEQRGHLRPDEHELGAVTKSLDLSLEDVELTIDDSFFLRPGELPILEPLREVLAEWLIGGGLPEARAHAVSRRLRSYYVFSLEDEWRNASGKYDRLQDALETPFARPGSREQCWRQYSTWLAKQVDEPMFDEGFSLRQVYVPLRVHWEERTREDQEDMDLGRGPEKKVVKHVVDAMETLRSWIDDADAGDAVRILSGGPGSGKSSFCKMLAADLVEKRPDLRVLFVPLHHFEPEEDLRDALDRFAADDPNLPEHPLDPKREDEHLVVIFDGLDELALRGKISQEIAGRFVREVQRTVGNVNRHGCRMTALLSGREIVVQSQRDEFRKERQILYLIGYLQTPENFHDPGELLAEDQRDLWWQRYGAQIGESFDSIPQVLTGSEKMQELTSQPLLNYLLALSYLRKNIDFLKNTNLNEIYADLLDSVFDRGWDRGEYRPLQGINRDDFGRVLEEIALAAWHGDGRTTTIQEVERHCTGSGLKKRLEAFQEGAKGGVTRLLTAFYFRQSGERDSGEKSFEFTHKSFGEYLAALRIVRSVEVIQKQMERREDDPDDGWDEREALLRWAQICGPTAMDEYIYDFVMAECRRRGKERCSSWQETMILLINYLLRHGMPMERLGLLSFLDQKAQARNAEEALLALLCACAIQTEHLSEIDWPSETSAGEWLRGLQGQRTGPKNRLVLSVLSHVSFGSSNEESPRQNLDLLDLHSASLRNANLVGISAQLILLGGANLREAHLEGANLEGAHLEGAHLRGAHLRGAHLRHARLRRANLEGAHLEGAHLEGAHLGGAHLRGAHLEGAHLKGANLEGVELRGARVSQKQIESAITDETTKLDDRLKSSVSSPPPGD